MVDDPGVQAFEAGGDQRHTRLRGQLFDERLVQRPTLRRQRDHPRRRLASVDRLERCRDHVDPQDHSGTAAIRRVVDLAGAERSRVAVVEEPELELGAEDRGERFLLGQPAESVRYLGEDVETHRARVSVT